MFVYGSLCIVPYLGITRERTSCVFPWARSTASVEFLLRSSVQLFLLALPCSVCLLSLSLSLWSSSQVGEEVPTTVSALRYGCGEATLLTHPLPTAGILYADFAFPLHDLTIEELQLLSLFSRLLTEGGEFLRPSLLPSAHLGLAAQSSFIRLRKTREERGTCCMSI